MSFASELKRRNGFRVTTTCVAGSWQIIQVAETRISASSPVDSPSRVLVILMGVAAARTHAAPSTTSAGSNRFGDRRAHLEKTRCKGP
jgi:hypothetical protein